LSSVAATAKASIRVRTTSATIMSGFLSKDCARLGLIATGRIGYRYSIAKKNYAVHTSLVRIPSRMRLAVPRWFAKPDSRCYTTQRVSKGAKPLLRAMNPITRQCFGWIVWTTVLSDRSGTLIMNTM
jgi:hypothetical protein